MLKRKSTFPFSLWSPPSEKQERSRQVFLRRRIEDASTEAVRRSDLDLILVDEGDWLNVESFEFLRHVFDRTGCPIVIVGLPHIMQVIARHEKFSSRVG